MCCMSCSRSRLPASSAAGDASAAWSSSRSRTSDRAVWTSSASLEVRVDAAGRSSNLAWTAIVAARGPVVSARAVGAGAAVVAARGPVIPPRGPVIQPRRLGPRRFALRGVGARHRLPVVAARGIGAGASIVPPRKSIIPPRATVNGGRQRDSRRRFPLRGGAAERGPRRGDDPGRLGAHAEDLPAPWVRISKSSSSRPTPNSSRAWRRASSDGLAGELAVRTHAQRFLPRRP